MSTIIGPNFRILHIPKTGGLDLIQIGRHERLAEDLIDFLDKQGTNYDRHIVIDRGKYIINRSKPMSFVWTDEMKKLMAKNHSDLFEAFSYEL